MSQGFRTYKEHRNPSYNEEVMARRSFYGKTGTAPGDVNSDFLIKDFLAYRSK